MRDDAPMDVAAARSVLGVNHGAEWPEVRAMYLRLIRRHHPDVAVDLADAGIRTLRTAQITEAFAILVAAQPRVSVRAPGRGGSPRPDATPDAGPNAGPNRGPETDQSDDGTDGTAATGSPGGAVFRHPAVGADDTRTVVLDAAPVDAFLALHEAFSVLGTVSYLDRFSLVLEAIVVPQPGRATSLLAWLETEAMGDRSVTTVIICVESLGGHPPADLDALVDRIAELLASPRPPVGSA